MSPELHPDRTVTFRSSAADDRDADGRLAGHSIIRDWRDADEQDADGV